MSNIVKYTANDGTEVTLSPDIIKKFLISGNSAYVNLQEMFYFMKICEARKLNPAKKDAYIIKYSRNDNAAIVVSIDHFRARAAEHPACEGWQVELIIYNPMKVNEGVLEPDNVVFSKGLLPPGYEVLGARCIVERKNWNSPKVHEVNLDGYVKKTRDGKLTQFWQKEKQPTMIMKVAESQALRKYFPDEFQGLYLAAEMPEAQTVDLEDKSLQNLQDLQEKVSGSSEPHDKGEDQVLNHEDTQPLVPPETVEPELPDRRQASLPKRISEDFPKDERIDQKGKFWSAESFWNGRRDKKGVHTVEKFFNQYKLKIFEMPDHIQGFIKAKCQNNKLDCWEKLVKMNEIKNGEKQPALEPSEPSEPPGEKSPLVVCPDLMEGEQVDVAAFCKIDCGLFASCDKAQKKAKELGLMF